MACSALHACRSHADESRCDPAAPCTGPHIKAACAHPLGTQPTVDPRFAPEPENLRMTRIATFLGALALCFLASSAFADDKVPVENGLSIGVRVGWASPFGNAAVLDHDHRNIFPLSDYASGQVPFWVDAGYLVNPFLYLGAYFSYGIVLGPSGTCGSGVNCSGSDVRIGAEVQYRFLGRRVFQPWIGLGVLGYERISTSATLLVVPPETETQAFDGVEWITPQVGLDYKILPALSAGLFAGISLSEYLGVSASLGPIFGNLLHEWVYVGGRVNYDLHI